MILNFQMTRLWISVHGGGSIVVGFQRRRDEWDGAMGRAGLVVQTSSEAGFTARIFPALVHVWAYNGPDSVWAWGFSLGHLVFFLCFIIFLFTYFVRFASNKSLR